MNRGSHEGFEFPRTPPLEGVAPGTNVLVSGPSGRGAREVALRLVTDLQREDEATLLVSADVDGRSLLERCETVAPDLDRSRVAVVDCSGARDDEQERFEPRGTSIEHPGALPEIGVELSRLYETLVDRGTDRVRIGVFSVSSLLAHAPLQPVSRFVHMLTGRVIATGDLGVFLVDAGAVDDRAVETIEGFCDGHVAVRDEDGLEIRVTGLGEEASVWRAVEPVDAE